MPAVDAVVATVGTGTVCSSLRAIVWVAYSNCSEFANSPAVCPYFAAIGCVAGVVATDGAVASTVGINVAAVEWEAIDDSYAEG